MAENNSKELKPKSFRITDETAEKFKEITATLGGNHQETLSKLIEAFEFQAGKVVLTEGREDLEQFERYVTAITRMYMSSLEANQTISETIRTEFDALLKSKDMTIQDLQEKLTIEKQVAESATEKAKSCAEENARLNNVIKKSTDEYNSKLDDMQSMLADKDSLNKALTDSCNTLKAKAESLEQAAEQSFSLQKELDQLKSDYTTLSKEKTSLERQLEQEQTAHNENIANLTATHSKTIADMKKHETDALERLREQSQLNLDKAVLEVERKYQKEIEKLKAEKQAEVDKYQQRYFEVLERQRVQGNTDDGNNEQGDEKKKQ